MRALTERQRQVLDFLHRHLQTHGLPPTLHELMHAFGWASPAGAAKHLQALAALQAPVDAFFEQVMVNAEDPALRRNRLALLGGLHALMNRVADLSQL